MDQLTDRRPAMLEACEKLDPRIRRTRQLLQGALRTLMQHKGFDEISVQDITEAATVNRATFYDHYTDKFALLDAMVGSGFHLLLHERKVRYDGTCASAAGAIASSNHPQRAKRFIGDSWCFIRPPAVPFE